MPKETVVGLAKPRQKDWEKYMAIFQSKPNVIRILELLKIRNSLEVKRCIRLFSSSTTRIANSTFRDKGLNVRLLANPDTIDEPLEDQTIHLYEIEIVRSKTPA